MTRLTKLILIVQLIASALIFAVTVGYSLRAAFTVHPVTSLLFAGLAISVGRFLYMPSVRELVEKTGHRQLP
ncbi:MAG: hypothetical protein NC411_10545 [Bacteroides sp.]|nr:hypothetical protein [Bacteroides sp.]